MRYEKYSVDHKFQVEDKIWLHISKERFRGPTKKFKTIRYGPFNIVGQVSKKDFKLNWPSYMNIYLVVNMDNVK